jgi:hypothetical protein
MRMTTWIGRLSLFALVLGLSVLPASATVIAGGVLGESPLPAGKFIKLAVPLRNPFGPGNSVGENTFDNPNLYAFDEDQNILLKADLSTDVGKHLIPAGKVVASHYVFFDPGPGTEIFGIVEFDSPVLAIITSTDKLAASDFLANTGVHYLNPGARGLEPGDSVMITGPNQITFHTVASNPGDYVRVLTEFSPRAKRITLVPSDRTRSFWAEADLVQNRAFGRGSTFSFLLRRLMTQPI